MTMRSGLLMGFGPAVCVCKPDEPRGNERGRLSQAATPQLRPLDRSIWYPLRECSLLREEIFIEPFELQDLAGAHAHAVFDHELGQAFPVD